MRANSTAAPAGRTSVLARRIGVAVLIAALGLVGRGVAYAPLSHANPAKIWVINGHVAAVTASTPVSPGAFDTAITTAAPRAPYLSQLDAFETATDGQVPIGPAGGFAGITYIIVQTDGSGTNVTLNGRGLLCTPICDGAATATPDPTDHIVLYRVKDTGAYSSGGTFTVTALEDAVSLDSRTLTVVGQAHDIVLSAAKTTIQEGLTSCAVSDSTSAPTRSAVAATYTDISGTPLVGYSTDWGTSAPGTMLVAATQTTSRLLADGTTVGADNVICGVAFGPATASATNTLSGAVQGVTFVTRNLTITVTGVPASVALTASPAVIPCSGTATSTVTAKVKDLFGNNVADGTNVNFSVVALGTANPLNVPTVAGNASSVITPLSAATSGVTVVVTSGGAQSSIRIDCALPPGPDSSATPQIIAAVPFTGFLSTTGFTTDVGESLPCGNMGATAWYELNLPLGGADLTVDTAGSSFNTALAVYRVGAASPPGGPSLVGCNANGMTSSVRLIAPSPGVYLFQAGGQNGVSGSLVLNVRCTNDADCDGLTDADEASLGTNTANSDTDGDGLPDGLEVHTLHTNPLLADTDGDGCGDAKELQLVPPLDPTDAWDFYSVPVPALFAAPNPLADLKDSVVGAGDAQAVFAYFKVAAKAGTPIYDQDLNNNGIKDGIEYDRTVLGPAHSGPPDGVVGASDAQIAFAQFKLGYHC